MILLACPSPRVHWQAWSVALPSSLTFARTPAKSPSFSLSLSGTSCLPDPMPSPSTCANTIISHHFSRPWRLSQTQTECGYSRRSFRWCCRCGRNDTTMTPAAPSLSCTHKFRTFKVELLGIYGVVGTIPTCSTSNSLDDLSFPT